MAEIRLHKVSKRYTEGEATVHALHEVDLVLDRGSFTAITGPSGCGKSTLLHLLGGLDQADEGEISVFGERVDQFGEARLERYRRDQVGVVFQAFHLLPTLTAHENVALPLVLAGVSGRESRQRAAAELERMELADRAGHYPHQLSGGQQQRVALARALVRRPPLLLADEPTGNLDAANAARVLEFISEANRRDGTTVVMVTHSSAVAAGARRRVAIRDGRLA